MRILLISLSLIFAIICMGPSLGAWWFYPHGYHSLLKTLWDAPEELIPFCCFFSLAILYMVKWKKPKKPYDSAVWSLLIMIVVILTGAIDDVAPILAIGPLILLVPACVLADSVNPKIQD